MVLGTRYMTLKYFIRSKIYGQKPQFQLWICHCSPISLRLSGCMFWVPLKDAWARIELHGCELRRMGAHGGTWTRTMAKEHAVAGADFKAEMLRHWTGVSKKLLRTTHVNETRNGAAWTRTPANEMHPAHGQRLDTNCKLQPNAINKMPRYRRGTERCRSASLYINQWCIVIGLPVYTCIINIWLLFNIFGWH